MKEKEVENFWMRLKVLNISEVPAEGNEVCASSFIRAVQVVMNIGRKGEVFNGRALAERIFAKICKYLSVEYKMSYYEFSVSDTKFENDTEYQWTEHYYYIGGSKVVINFTWMLVEHHEYVYNAAVKGCCIWIFIEQNEESCEVSFETDHPGFTNQAWEHYLKY